MILRVLAVSVFQSNCFILGCQKTKEGVVIDPGGGVNSILKVLKREGLKLRYIINTHAHIDHVAGNWELKEATKSQILIHSADAPLLSRIHLQGGFFGLKANPSPEPDKLLKEGDLINIGEEITLRVLHTPGHTPGGISLLLDNMVFAGDTLFLGSIGRTDLSGGSYESLIESVTKKIFPLGDEVQVYPGHGPPTTVGREKRHNPFFRC